MGVEEDRSSLENSGSSRLSYDSLTVEGNVHISEKELFWISISAKPYGTFV